DLGGTSLALINVVVEMSKRFSLPFNPGIVAQGATVSALAAAVREQMAAQPQDTEIEQTITEIWKSALGTNNVGTTDDFFDLGGTSLALINVVVEMSKRFSLPFNPGIVAQGATVSALAAAVREQMAPSSVVSSLQCLVA
ncbi:MAG TPA: phosphopantetheine-binding protein, partial [Candidatus Angelobacter sp.]|nr:phosphopantetheine-binding protein [Candidatus Angelobacter sp.]